MTTTRKSNKSKKPSYEKTHYVLAGFVTLLILVSGILIGESISGAKVEYARQLNTQLTLESRSIQLKHTIAGSDICTLFDPNTLFGELYEVGSKLDYLEQQRKKDDIEIKQLKEYYQILEIENWLLIKEYQQRCSETDVKAILYFYSNEGDCPSCEQQGHALTYLRKKNDHLYVFSFDINTDNPAVTMLKNVYDVEQAPSIVVGSETYSGLKTADSVLNLLDQLKPTQEFYSLEQKNNNS